jgi:chemotaxis protein histidine kinase CheA
MFKSADGLSGATILGDGTVALIVDVNRLGLVAQQEEMLGFKNDATSVSEAV